jgi:hypothetical protein
VTVRSWSKCHNYTYRLNFFIFTDWALCPEPIQSYFLKLITLQTTCRSSLTVDRSRARPLPTNNTIKKKREHTSICGMRFEPTIAVFERPKSVGASDSAAAEKGKINLSNLQISETLQLGYSTIVLEYVPTYFQKWTQLQNLIILLNHVRHDGSINV